MGKLIISSGILSKLREKHAVSSREVEQCFDNREGKFLYDKRPQHLTNPLTQWFIAPTNKGRLLKVVFVLVDGRVHLRSAFEPNEAELSMYNRHGRS